MLITGTLTDQAALRELGARLRQRRLDANVSQAVVASKVGLGRRTIQRLEDGEDTTLSTLIRVLRYYGLLDALDRLIPEPGPDPLALLESRRGVRQRARRRTQAQPPDGRPFRWGDEE